MSDELTFFVMGFVCAMLLSIIVYIPAYYRQCARNRALERLMAEHCYESKCKVEFPSPHAKL